MNTTALASVLRPYGLLVAHLILFGFLPLTAALSLSQATPNSGALRSSGVLSVLGILVYVRCVIAWPLSIRGAGTWPAQPMKFIAAVFQIAVPVGLLGYYFGEFISPWQVFDASWTALASILIALVVFQKTKSPGLFTASLATLLASQLLFFGEVLGPFPTVWTFLPLGRIGYFVKPLVSAAAVILALASLPSRGWLAGRYGIGAACLWTMALGLSAAYLPGEGVVPMSYWVVFGVLAYFVHRRTDFADTVLRFLAPAICGASLSMLTIALVVAENTARSQAEVFVLMIGAVSAGCAAVRRGSEMLNIQESQSVARVMDELESPA